MATTTLPRGSQAPTESEIRSAVVRAWSGPGDAIETALFDLIARTEALLYDEGDFRRSERDDIDADGAVDRIVKALVIDLEDVVADAILAFAAKHPDAPRAKATVAA